MQASLSVIAPGAVKRDRVVYWITTGIIALLMFGSGLNFGFGPSTAAAASHLGLPRWFFLELATAKLLGSVAFVAPFTPPLVREFTYFGFALTIVSADIAHLSSGDSALFVIPHLFFLGCLVVSHRLFHRLHPGPGA